MKNATPIYESSALINDKSTTTPPQCKQIVAFIQSNLPANENSFTYEITQ